MIRVLAIGAHPDDCDIFAGGTAALWRRRGDLVRFVSMTRGDAGHHAMEKEALALRRREEARRAAKIIGIEYQVLDHPDGEVFPSLECRFEVIRLIREFRPDLVLTHRPFDYHPDHRYTSTLVLDSAYMVTVPLVCPDVPHLERNPVLGYLFDDFERPVPFRPDVLIDVGEVMDLKWRMLEAHESQFYEWLPANQGRLDAVPDGGAERRAWLEKEWEPFLERPAERFRDRLVELHGERGRAMRHVEVFEIGEHGRRPEPQEIRRLFPLESDSP